MPATSGPSGSPDDNGTRRMLEIRNLHATAGGQTILRGIDLTVNAGEVHAIMGPNGSGKSTLASVLAGRETVEVTQGSVSYDGQDLLALAPEKRAATGVFLGFQYPVEIPGVANLYFLRTALNAVRRARGQEELDAMDFLQVAREKLKLVQWDQSFVQRGVNEGFSGGEKKRNEILQMAVLEPRLAILDEIDSGLDIDALRVVADGVNSLRSKERSFLIVTHYQRLLDYVKPDFVHVMAAGRIVKSGGPELALELERKGYAGWMPEKPAEPAEKPAARAAP
jgi:Fe-S cluster assembly ATP-binding protein